MESPQQREGRLLKEVIANNEATVGVSMILELFEITFLVIFILYSINCDQVISKITSITDIINE